MHAAAQPLPGIRTASITRAPLMEDDIEKTLQYCALPSIEGRQKAVFLRGVVASTAFSPTPLVAKVMGQCLEGFIRSIGGKFVYATEYARDGSEASPGYEVITLESGLHRFLKRGWLYIETPAGRVVIYQVRVENCEDEVSC